ncbi:MAG: hypothetical protein ACI8ZB_004518 [Desulforhopalus sp.]|jgi:uncharacterized protein YciI
MQKVTTWVFLALSIVLAGNVSSNGLTPDQKARIADFLSMNLYVYETTLVGTPEEFKNTVSAHLDYQVMLENKGIMFGAGPLTEENTSDHPTSGLIIIRANSFDEAKAIADADPFHAGGVRSYKLRKWTLNEGSFNFTVNISDQTVEIK